MSEESPDEQKPGKIRERLWVSLPTFPERLLERPEVVWETFARHAKD